MSVYSDLSQRDVLEWALPVINNGTYRSRLSDGKLERQCFISQEINWNYIKPMNPCNCPYWLDVFFMVVTPRSPAGQFMHSRCHRCWKVVVPLKTVAELFVLEQIQYDMGVPCKCGLDTRSYTSGNYAGFFYCESMAEGIKRLKQVRDMCSAIDHGIYLKRACTEMEMVLGRSDKWVVKPENYRVEKLIDNTFVNDFPLDLMKPAGLDHCHRGWIQYAYKIGDESYKQFTDGQPLFHPSARYEEKEEDADS